MKSQVPTPIEILKEDLDMAVIGLRSVYQHIESARRISEELNRSGAVAILGGCSNEIRDMLNGKDGEDCEIGLAELRDGVRKEVQETQS